MHTMTIIRCLSLIALFIGISLPSRADDYSGSYRNLPFEASVPEGPSIPSRRVSLNEFGGKGDGITLNTEAFAKAISHLTTLGGGHLDIPAGIWMTGPVALKSNIDIHIDKEAIILFSPDKSLYPILPPDAGTGSTLCTAPFNASGQSNFSITGEGIIDGYGEAWRPVKRFKVSDAEWRSMEYLGLTEVTEGKSTLWYPTLGNQNGSVTTKRPRLLRFIECSNFAIQGVIVQNSPSFHVNMILCHDFILDGITVRCPWNAQNGYGIDLSSCLNVLLTGCSVDAGDDAICLKSGIGDDGRRRGPCSNIVIDSCTVFHGHGGFVIGSDTSGGMENIAVTHCRFIDTDTGIRIKSGRDRGGLVHDIWISDIVMCDIADEAILFDSYYQEKVGDGENVQPQPVTADTPIFTGIHISGVICTDARRAVVMKGLPEMRPEGITISNSTITSRLGSVINHANGITFDNVTLNITDGQPVTIHGSNNIVVNGNRLSDQ